MQLAVFNARCDLEIGDDIAYQNAIPAKVTNIRCTHYVLTGNITFEFELSIFPGCWVGRNDIVFPVPDLYGQLSSPEIAQMHRDGTLCEKCGEHLGKTTGKPELCDSCHKDYIDELIKREA